MQIQPSHSQSIISQDKYPYKAVIDGDTVGVFTIPQVQKIDTTFKRNDDCRQNLRYEKTTNLVSKMVIKKQAELMTSYINDSIRLKAEVLNRDTIITNDALVIKKLNRQNTGVKIGGGLGWLGFIYLCVKNSLSLF